jgi:hypothetical protein
MERTPQPDSSTQLRACLLLAADTNWDYPGSCGRCYEVRCKNGLVLDKGAPVSTAQFFDMGKANPNYRDTKGRKWPGGCCSLWGPNCVKRCHAVTPVAVSACGSQAAGYKRTATQKAPKKPPGGPSLHIPLCWVPVCFTTVVSVGNGAWCL